MTKKLKNCVCKGCGICTKMERENVFLINDIFSIMSDTAARCHICESYRNGSTLKVLSPLIKELKEKTRLSVLDEVEKKFLEYGKHGEKSALQHNVEFYRWLKQTIGAERK